MIFRIEVAPAVHVPRTRGATFSYTHTESLLQGTLVRVSFGRQASVQGIVVESSKLTTRPPYPLKPISTVLGRGAFFAERLYALLEWEAVSTITAVGDVYKQALPPWLRISGRRRDITMKVFPESQAVLTKTQRPEIIVSELPEQIKTYKKYSRVTKATNTQMLILAPSAVVQATLLTQLPEAIPAPLGVTKGAMATWLRIREGESLVVVGTKNALRLPFVNLTAILLHDEGSDLYKETRSHPYTDAREAAKHLARIHGASYVALGALPSFETIHEAKQEITFPKLRGPLTIIDLQEMKPRGGLAEPLVEELRELSKKKTDAKAFLYVNRRGDALALTCKDCDYVFTCKNCDAPMPVYRASRIDPEATEGLRLRCRHCSEVFIPPLVCPQCRGFSLRPRGLAGAALEETIQRIHSRATVLRLDSDTAPSAKAQREIIEKFHNAKGFVVLIGTKMALTHSLSPVHLVAVPAFDQLGALPDFRADEATLRTLMALSQMRKENGSFFIQAWHPSRPILKTFQTEEIAAFVTYELSMRKQFGWPPFTRVAKLTFEHRSPAQAEKSANALASTLHHVPKLDIVGPTPAFIPKIRGKYRWVLLLKWTNVLDSNDIEKHLRAAVPTTWDIDVSPATIL